MPSVHSLILAVLCPALLGLLGMAAPRRRVALRVGLAVAAPAISLALLLGHIAAHGTDAAPSGIPWMPSLQLALSFHPDRLGLFFALLVSSVGVLITLYARSYFGPDQNALYRIYPSLLLFMTGMLGLVLADNFILFLLFWELTSISSFLLIGWERDDAAAVKNALQAFIVTGAGGIALLGGLVLLGTATGVWSFSDLAARGDLSGWQVNAAFLLVFIGVATKSAQWPLHFWLPGAMAAPTPISAYLHSATMVKAGIYLLARLADPMAQLPLWPVVLIPIGTVTMVLGAYVALRKSDLKLIFAYTTVSQLGLFVCMYGVSALGTAEAPALLWDVTQILNHALYKAPLFILAGAIAHVTYSRDLRDLYGLFYQGRAERRMAILMLLAAYAMAAGPLTLGFTAKEFFLYGVHNAYTATRDPLLIGVMIAVVCQGALNVAIFVRIAITLLGPESAADAQPPHDPDAEEERIAYEDYHAVQAGFWRAMLWVPATLLLAVQYLGGIAPALLDPLLKRIERNPVGFDALPGLWYALTHPSPPLALSLLAMVLGAALALAPTPLGHAPFWRSNVRDWHDRLFPSFYALVTRGGGRLFGLFQRGNLRAYLFVICGALAALVAWAAFRSGHVPELSSDTLDEPPWRDRVITYATGTLVCLGALLMPFTQRRAGRVMILGAVGFAVTALFYVYGAPDLALTQVTIETVSLILFLLALSLLPRTVTRVRERAVGILRVAVAVAVGAAMFWLTLSSSLDRRKPMSWLNADAAPFAHLGEFFLRNSYAGQDVAGRHPGGGGNNAVNVILVDFRGLDTFGEITVLAVAALGVLALLYRPRRGSASLPPVTLPPPADANTMSPPSRSSAPKVWEHRYSLTSEPLRVATKLLVPLSLLFAVFVFLKGHQSPGGGFVAGLIAAIALIAHRLAHGRASLRHLLRVREQTFIASGLLFALAAGLGPALLGRPFLTSRSGYVEFPGTDNQVAWATALVFDLGVFLVVLGVVLAMINAMSKESEVA